MPPTLPSPLTDAGATARLTPPAPPGIPPDAPLSANQQSLVDLALKCNLDMASPAFHDGLVAEHAVVRTQGAAAEYLSQHERVIAAHRRRRHPRR